MQMSSEDMFCVVLVFFFPFDGTREKKTKIVTSRELQPETGKTLVKQCSGQPVFE